MDSESSWNRQESVYLSTWSTGNCGSHKCALKSQHAIWLSAIAWPGMGHHREIAETVCSVARLRSATAAEWSVWNSICSSVHTVISLLMAQALKFKIWTSRLHCQNPSSIYGIGRYAFVGISDSHQMIFPISCHITDHLRQSYYPGEANGVASFFLASSSS